jgi:hypothetical protein
MTFVTSTPCRNLCQQELLLQLMGVMEGHVAKFGHRGVMPARASIAAAGCSGGIRCQVWPHGEFSTTVGMQTRAHRFAKVRSLTGFCVNAHWQGDPGMVNKVAGSSLWAHQSFTQATSVNFFGF